MLESRYEILTKCRDKLNECRNIDKMSYLLFVEKSELLK